MDPSTAAPAKIFNRGFVVLNLVIMLAFANLAILFQLQSFLLSRDISSAQIGTLIGLFSLPALLMRPLFGMLLHPANARIWASLGAGGTIVALLAYEPAGTFLSLAVVRLLHGAAYTLLAAAVMALLVGHIPADKSGQAFGIVSVATLLPYAVLPPLVPMLSAWTGGLGTLLRWTAVVMIAIFPLLRMQPPASPGAAAGGPLLPSIGKLAGNLFQRRVGSLLAAMLMLYSSFAALFFFLAQFAAARGILHPGLFFTVATVTMIVVRLAASHWFDKTSKPVLAATSLLLAAMGYALLAYTGAEAVFFLLAFVLGLAWAVAMPLLNALMFDHSAGPFRAFNLNMAIWTVDGGFFLGPLLGAGMQTEKGSGELFFILAGAALLGLVFLAGATIRGPEKTSQG